MHFPGLLAALETDPAIRDTLADVVRPGITTLDLSALGAFFPWLTAAIANQGKTVLAVTSTYREAEQLTDELATWLGEEHVAYYPAWETLPHERLSPRADTVGRRLDVLRRLASPTPPRAIVAPVRSLLQPQVKGLADMRPVEVRAGQTMVLSELLADLQSAAYSRVDLVERRGEFAVRGGIVDVFPPTLEHPVRIDFFGDDVEEIRQFTVADQRSFGESLAAIVAPPCRELLLTDEVRARAKQLAIQHPELADMLIRIEQGQAVEGMEALIPVLVDGLELLVDVLPSDALVLAHSPELIRTRAAELVATSREFLEASWAAAASGGRSPIDLDASAYWELSDVRAHALQRGLRWWQLSPFSVGDETDERHIPVSGVETFRGDSEAALQHLRNRIQQGWAMVLMTEGAGLAQRLVELCGEAGIAAVASRLDEAPEPSVVHVVVGNALAGWCTPEQRIELLTTAELTGQQPAQRTERKLPSRRKHRIEPLELKKGDYVVHEQHGVGRFVESAQRIVHGAARDYLVIEYAPSKRGQPGDRLFVPMDQLDQLSRYVGNESPSLDRMGGADWNKRKSKARKAVREISAELIKLYAARQATTGHAFAPDNDWQRELEDSFSHIETPDQLSAIDEVKRDMERTVPMDRLICGDVGYGKTEIAVRAAFKAVQDGKQVAVLVPTTILVGQHYQTFSSRFAGFPVKVAQLSRFQTDKQAAQVIDGLARGTVDVVIGTHRLLSKEIGFKDLGLVIIDEEQRFGVEHKERLKTLRVNVDVLSMSATPIPRTLETAITGIREMSTITTPPEERHPVLTFAGPYDDAQVRAAIRRELAREGQVYYVHNRVGSIEKTAAHIRDLVPEARIVTAHGQMSERRLEDVMQQFIDREVDVLVSTTIVESGLNIQSANTLIVDRADALGLSQMHQLRGRVGRSRERGYAYFLYPTDKPLSETSHERLATMSANTDLGAGMAIAMRDLELRGAGNLLGEDQSGHIEGVGFDLYLRMVGEAFAAYKGEETEVEPAMRVELPVDANLPDEYIASERLRLQMYKQIAEIRTEQDIAATLAELADRYGDPPDPVLALLDVARLRNLARDVGIQEIVPQGKVVRFAPAALPESRKIRLERLYPGTRIKDGHILVPKPDSEPLEWALSLLRAVFA